MRPPQTTYAPLPRAAALALIGLLAIVAGSCQGGSGAWVSPIPFDTTSAVIVTAEDSVQLLVEIAATEEQRAFGLSRRPALDPGSGMIFRFDSIQGPDRGFWMWRTNIPLDIAYLDEDGVILRILSMETCGARAESCPTYPPGVEYASALEAGLGWFERNGITTGDRVHVLPGG